MGNPRDGSGAPGLLNEALHLGRHHHLILIFAWSVWFLGFYSLTLLTFLLEPVKRAFGPTELGLAWLMGIAIGATGVGGLLFGWLADRIGRRTSIRLAVATIAVGNALSAIAPQFTWFAIARAVAGLGVGGSWGAGQALIGETFPASVRGRFGAVAQTGAPLGLGLAAIAGSFIAPVVGWRVVFGVSTLVILILVLLREAPESDLWQAHPRGGEPLRELFSGTNVKSFATCFLLTAFNMSNYWLAVSWLPRYLQKERGLSEARSGWSTLAFVIGSLSGYLAFGALADRLGRRITFTIFCGVMAGGLLMVTIFWPLFAGRPDLILVFMFVAGVGTGTWSSYGPMFSEIFPTAVRGAALSIIMNSTRAVQFLAPIIIAAVAPRWGMSGGIALAAGFAVLAGLWIWMLPETKGKKILAGQG